MTDSRTASPRRTNNNEKKKHNARDPGLETTILLVITTISEHDQYLTVTMLRSVILKTETMTERDQVQLIGRQAQTHRNEDMVKCFDVFSQ